PTRSTWARAAPPVCARPVATLTRPRRRCRRSADPSRENRKPVAHPKRRSPMNLFRMWLTLAAWAGFALSGAAGPAPALVSQGPIADALRLLGMLPRTAPLSVTPAVMAEEGIIALERRAAVAVRVRRTVTVMVPV